MPMVGQAVPLVLIPRFSSYLGAGDYSTAPLEVTAFKRATVTIWRGPLAPSSGTGFKLYVETSHDMNTWSLEPSGSTGYDPGAGLSMIVTFECRRRYVRVRVSTTGSGASVTCWCSGILEYRIED